MNRDVGDTKAMGVGRGGSKEAYQPRQIAFRRPQGGKHLVLEAYVSHQYDWSIGGIYEKGGTA